MRRTAAECDGRSRRGVCLECDASRPAFSVSKLHNTSVNRHRCEVLSRVCLFNGTLMPLAADRRLSALAASMKVRSPTYSHHEFPLREMHALEAAPEGSLAERLAQREVAANGVSTCVPLVWLPTWVTNYGEFFIGSVSGVRSDRGPHAAPADSRRWLANRSPPSRNCTGWA